MAEENRSGAEMEELELASRMLQIQSKRFYLDVKQNRRGRFIKIAEVGSGGRKSRILLSIMAANEFKNRLNTMDTFYKSTGDTQQPAEGDENGNGNGERTAQANLLKSDVMYYENRRYYLDLKENSRGKFLRVTQMVLRASAPRSQVAIPAQGMEKLRDALGELLNEFGREQSPLPESTRIRVDNKMFFCDVRQNNRGVFMRISEVQRNYRSVISVPQKGWIQFRNYFMDVCDEMAKLNSGGASENAADEEEASPESVGNDSEREDHVNSGEAK